MTPRSSTATSAAETPIWCCISRCAAERAACSVPASLAAEVFGPVPDDLIIAQLAADLRWGAAHAPGEYAVLNACRAWRFAADGTLVSKIDGGQWALGQVSGPDRELIKTALDRQRSVPTGKLVEDAVKQFVQQALSHLT